MNDAFYNAKGRIIVACFASNLIEFNMFLMQHMKVAGKLPLLGKSLKRMFDIAFESRIFRRCMMKLIIPVNEINTINRR